MNNPVAKYLRKFNESAKQVDRKKQEKRKPKDKHKNKEYNDQ